MTDDEINVAIAEACGWTDIHDDPDWGWIGKPPGHSGRGWPLFKYCECLNAMHEAEKVLSASDKRFHLKYIPWLHITAADNGWGNYAAAHATARQRAEAFLRTLGKWVK